MKKSELRDRAVHKWRLESNGMEENDGLQWETEEEGCWLKRN